MTPQTLIVRLSFRKVEIGAHWDAAIAARAPADVVRFWAIAYGSTCARLTAARSLAPSI